MEPKKRVHLKNTAKIFFFLAAVKFRQEGNYVWVS